MTPLLSEHQKFHSHLASCKDCGRYESATIFERSDSPAYPPDKLYELKRGVKAKFTGKGKHKLCPVGRILLANALKEDPIKNPFRPRFFPFVAKMYQVCMVRVGSNWFEGKVVDRSIGANGRPVGYEIETQGGDKHYINSRNIKPIPVDKLSKGVVVVTPTNDPSVPTTKGPRRALRLSVRGYK